MPGPGGKTSIFRYIQGHDGGKIRSLDRYSGPSWRSRSHWKKGECVSQRPGPGGRKVIVFVKGQALPSKHTHVA